MKKKKEIEGYKNNEACFDHAFPLSVQQMFVLLKRKQQMSEHGYVSVWKKKLDKG